MISCGFMTLLMITLATASSCKWALDPIAITGTVW